MASKAFGFKKPAPGKGSRLGSARSWAREKAVCDIPVESDRRYWRYHDSYYDLSTFNHPGGDDWLDFTRGNDITELVESSHPNIDKIKAILPKYFVRHCTKDEPRNSGAFTFKEDGFYCVLRKRAWEILRTHGTGASFDMLFLHDSLLLSFFALLSAAMLPNLNQWSWVTLAILAGFILQCVGTVSHNFYHKRTNWRMFTWDLTPYASYEWRISHAYSHHTFPNTAYDYEVTVFEPFLLFLPIPKSFARLILTPFMIQFLACVGMHLQASKFSITGPKITITCRVYSDTQIY
jgi:hypothetical protein